MKLTFGIAAALAGCSAAAHSTGQVFTFPTRESSSTTSLSRSAAHLIIMQRLAAAGNEPSINTIPTDIDTDKAVSLINTFGRELPGLFSKEAEQAGPRRLLVMLEGMSSEQMQKAAKTLKSKPSFTINDPPSSAANNELFEDDLYSVGATTREKCKLGDILNQKRDECWNQRSAAVKYSVEKAPAVLDELLGQLATVSKLAQKGEIESTIVFLPTASESSHAAYWSDVSQELRRRQNEQVMSKEKPHDTDDKNKDKNKDKKPVPKAKILACYDTKASCEEATASCSGHGSCADKYGRGNEDEEEGEKEKREDKDTKDTKCFVCSCSSSKADSGSMTHWAGPTCSKIDVSVPFWLFFGFTIVMVAVLYMAIGLLFSVGEEKLPGVIGAGVAKAK